MGCEGILLGEGRAGALECSTRDGKGAGARGGSELTDLPLGPRSSGPGRGRSPRAHESVGVVSLFLPDLEGSGSWGFGA